MAEPRDAAIARLSLAYSEVVQVGQPIYEGSMLGPIGPRVAVHVPEPQWTKLVQAICELTGADVV